MKLTGYPSKSDSKDLPGPRDKDKKSGKRLSLEKLKPVKPMLATLADLALGYAMLAKTGDRGGFVTAHLAVDYAGACRAGDWVESQVEIQRVGSRLAFANCYLVANGARIVRASAIFAREGQRE